MPYQAYYVVRHRSSSVRKVLIYSLVVADKIKVGTLKSLYFSPTFPARSRHVPRGAAPITRLACIDLLYLHLITMERSAETPPLIIYNYYVQLPIFLILV